MHQMTDPNSGWPFVLFVISLWLSISALLAYVSGWRSLAARFASEAGMEGERFRFRSANIGYGFMGVNYGSCLFSIVGRDALALWVFFIFGFMQPRLIIPWAQVKECRWTRFWLVPALEIRIKGFGGRLLLYGGFGRAVLKAWSEAGGGAVTPDPIVPRS
jgi:hypothetical protein